MRGVFVISQIVNNGRFSTRPGTHKQNQWFGEDFWIAKVAIAQITVFVHGLQGLNGIFVNPLDITQNDFRYIVHSLFTGIGLVVEDQKLIDMIAVSAIGWNFTFLKCQKIY